MNTLKRMWARVMEMVAVPVPDAVSHVLHWIVVIGLTCAMASFGGALGFDERLWGYVVSELILYGFCLWEGFNWGTHRAKGEDMTRWTRDGAWDLAGPVLNRIIWIVVWLA